jgi:hypothetical protein
MFSNKRRVLAIVLAVVMALSLGMAIGGTQDAYAATNDDYLYTYGVDFFDDSLYQTSTFVLNSDETEVYYVVFPGNEYGVVTGFDNSVDAQSVADDILDGVGSEIFADDGIEDTVIDYAGPYEDSEFGWGIDIHVTLPENISDDSFGAISVQVTNTAYGGIGDDPFTNITIVRQPETAISNISPEAVALYNSSSEPFAKSMNLDVTSVSFSESPDRGFPTAADAIYYAVASGSFYGGTITNLHSTFYTGLGYILDSVTANGTTYDNDYPYGWMYAIYNSNDDRVELSKYIGFDSYRLFPGDFVAWKYGNYSDYDTLFPTHWGL